MGISEGRTGPDGKIIVRSEHLQLSGDVTGFKQSNALAAAACKARCLDSIAVHRKDYDLYGGDPEDQDMKYIIIK